ncbi:PAS domain S-box protein [Kallotenue papyrolyticum]|uniref:PAS domain S-box protein n=1 Tax=Kallotenue papyrolyticum TaxID=1325125 RepID=UPI00047867B9|nr:PAS domain S-box protein [Kallotenue papyrolyticum]
MQPPVDRARDDERASLRQRIHELEQRLAAYEAQALHSEQRYRLLADSLPQIIYATNADGAWIYVNQYWHDYTGLSQDESLGSGALAALHPDDREHVLAHWRHLHDTDGAGAIEYRLRRHDGQYRWFIDRAQPIRSATGTLIGWAGVCHDIDAQHRTIDALRFLANATQIVSQSLDVETTLQRLAHLAVPYLADWCAIDICQADGRLQRMAVAHVDPHKVALAHELYRRVPFDPAAPHGVARVLRSGQAELIPVITEALVCQTVADPEVQRILLALGLHSSMIVPLMARGRILGTLTLVSAESRRQFGPDDLRLAEDLARRTSIAIDNARLYHEQSQLRHALDQIYDGVLLFDPDTLQIHYANRGALEQLVADAAATPPATLHELLPALDEQHLRDLIASLRHGEHLRRLLETTHRRPDGVLRQLDITLQYITLAHESAGCIAVIRDVTERRQIEEELHRQSGLMTTILENATSALFMMDPDGRCTFMNRAAEEMTGYRLEEIRAMALHDAIHHHYADGRPFPRQACPLDRALEQNQPVRDHEDVFIRKNGEFFPVMCAARPIYAQGRPVGTVIEVRDITAEKQARQQALERALQQEALLNTVPAIAFYKDCASRYITVNRAFAELVNRPLEAIAGKTDFDFFPRELAERYRRDDHAVITSGQPCHNIEEQVHDANGQVRWVTTFKTPIRDAQGRVTGLVGISFDTTARKQMEAERERLIHTLEFERARLAELFINAPAFIAILRGPHHVFERTNPAYDQLIGYRQIIGKPVAEALPEVVAQGFIELLDRVYQSGEPFIGREVRVLLQRQPQGPLEERFVNFVYQPMREADGAIGGIYVHGVDVTDMVLARREIERRADELQRLTQALEASNRELDQFAYITSHDLKAPLRGIANLAQWIEEDLGERATPNIRQHLTLLRGRVLRMEGLIDGILQYSRVGRSGGVKEHVDVRQLLDEILDLLAPPQHATITITDGMPVLFTERLPLHQVFSNLIGNAIKHHHGPALHIRISAEQRAGLVEFAVADNGPGIAPQYHERIFGIFQTLAPRDQVEGSGLGLALVKKIVEHQGGRVWVESDEGQGATFRFTWPAAGMPSA